ncbi:hypothetical protein K501DRAFT_265459 [Backusella circina FSU 941]|nr:hypothetical protein K501DRAFT_265459 [Backusella circina FSU 941]
MKTNDILPELLTEVSLYLSRYDCFSCMSVSRHWYNCIKRQFYKKVDIKNTLQFDSFLQTLHRSRNTHKKRKEHTEVGYLVKELRLISYGMCYPIIVLTQDKLNTLSDLCPRLEVLEFDSSQWVNLNNMSVFESWKNLTSIAPLHCKYIHYVSFASRLTQLRIFHTSQEENQLFTVFPNMPFLKYLTLDIFCGQPNANTGLDVDQYLKTLHSTVPQLEALCLMFTNSQSETPSTNVMHHSTRIKLKSLSLKGIPNVSYWFRYISKNYRLLENLEISEPIISNINTYLQMDAIVQLVQQLSSLKKLSLKGENACYLYSDALINELGRSECNVRQFEYDFNAYDLNRSTQFLNSIAKCPLKQLQRLQIRVGNQRLTWPGVIQGIYYCNNLVDLELWFARGFMDAHPYTHFVIDEFMQQMPRLKRLCLREADVQLGKYEIKGLALEILDLRDSRITQMKEFCQFVSDQCTSLTQLSLSPGEGAVTLTLSNNRLEKLYLFYFRTRNHFLSVVPSIENQTDITDFCLVKEKNHRRLATVDELIELQWRKDLDLAFALIRIQCKSLRQLYVDDTRLPFHYFRQYKKICIL